MSTKPRVCILSFSYTARDLRVTRQIELATGRYQLEVIGYRDWTPPEGVVYHQVTEELLNPLLRLPLFAGGRFIPALWDTLYWKTQCYQQAYQALINGRFDLIHANDWDSLPVAARAAQQTGARVLYDAHEYTPGQAVKKSRAWLTIPYRMYLLKKYMPQTTAMVTVSEGLQEMYRDNYGWEAELIRNIPNYQAVSFRPVDPQRICLVHHGIAVEVRRIDSIINLVPLLDDRFHLYLYLVPSDPSCYAKLKEQATKVAPGRVHIMPPVPPADIVSTIADYDIGIPLVLADHLSYENALPNKFFHYITAGLCIGVTPLRIMKQYVEQYNIGVVSAEQTSASLAACLNSLVADQINTYKRNSLELARTLNAENEMKKLLTIYERLLKE